MPSSVRTMLLWYVTSAQLHPCSQTLSRRENSAKPSTWKGGNAFGSIEPQVTTTSETSCWEDQRLNRCSGYALLKTPRPRHSMQARQPIRSVLLPQSCVGGANVPSLWRTGAKLQDRCQCHSAPSTGCWPSASLRFRMAATRERAPSPHTGGTPSDLAERRLKITVVEDRGPIKLSLSRNGKASLRLVVSKNLVSCSSWRHRGPVTPIHPFRTRRLH